MTRSLRMYLAGSLAAAAAVTVGISGVSALAAAPAGTFQVDYDASGSTYVVASKGTTKLGPATLTTYVSDSGDGSFTGSLPLPPVESVFYVGSIPNYGTVNYIPVGPVTGKLSDTSPTTVTSMSEYIIKITNASIGKHRHPINVGDRCQTVSPVTIVANTPKGQSFDITDGGTLTGTYTIPQFANCRIATHIINHHVSGPGNTVTLKISNGRFVG